MIKFSDSHDYIFFAFVPDESVHLVSSDNEQWIKIDDSFKEVFSDSNNIIYEMNQKM